MIRRQVVITGTGLVSALGEGPDAHWNALSAGTAPVVDEASYAPWTVHPLPALSLDTQIPKKGDQRQMEPWQRLGTYAAGLAIDDAGARDLVADMHLIVAAGGGERDVPLDEQVNAELANANDPAQAGARLNELLATGLRPTLFLAQLSNLLAGNISIVHGVTGSSRTFMGEESAAADAVRIAHARLAEGRGEIALVGGAFTAQRWDLVLLYRGGDGMWEGPHKPLSERPASGQGGMILGGMAGFLVLETEEHARARGARILARLDSVASDASRRAAPGEAAEAARALLPRVAPEGVEAVISGASGAPDAWAEEEAFLRGLDAPVRRPANLIGHGVEGAFPAHVALAALALSRGGFYGRMDPADSGDAAAPSRILVTGFGQWRGEALAALSRAEKN
ncbi:beta-ketoacyl-ACP synthase [Roseomonas sp. SSH11]|uniref:Beta-ketoacyl-ACP synthase n=1 Tax=Pararoseomonas baculiformis TaxID=2820812 RepID=A0ABS4ACZ8_9PROT|nr:beta-ketoacyl-ACP synthase [Pararoseomonas baculiformis]MBP0444882.1 beta-ketoacyl-ACP synthase [Pararoseomonas baculiformis]